MIALLLTLAHGALAAAPALTTPEILERMVRAETERAALSQGYSGMRRYHFENKFSGKRADVTVQMICGADGAKTFNVVREEGSAFVRKHIIGRMLEAERNAGTTEEREQTRILPQNYEFRLVGADTLEGRAAYILELTPKRKSSYAVRGLVWVDAEDFAVTRLEGSPAKNPSFWIRSVKVAHRYARFGGMWLPVSNHSHAEARIFGSTEVNIDYFDYQRPVAPGEAPLENSSAAR